MQMQYIQGAPIYLNFLSSNEVILSSLCINQGRGSYELRNKGTTYTMVDISR